MYQFFCFLPIVSRMAGSNTKLVSVAVTKVSEVSQPRAIVPPKSLKQKITNPAIKTRDV